MKTNQTIALLVVAVAVVSCRMGSEASESKGPAVNTSEAHANAPAVAPGPAVPLVFPSQLIQFAMEDLEWTNQRLKDSVIEVSGEVAEVSAGTVLFQPRLSHRVYCQGDLDYDKSHLLGQAAADFLTKRRATKPIARVRGTYMHASVSEFTTPYKGTDVQVFLEKCEIITVTP